MSKVMDAENLMKAVQTTDLLLNDLRALIKSDNTLLSDVVLDILAEAVQVEQRLVRLQHALNCFKHS